MLAGSACFVTVAVPFLAAGQPTDAQANKGLAELQGTWKLVSVEINGKAIDVTDRQPRWVIKRNKVRYGGEDLALLTVDAAAAPQIIDLSFLNPKKVYEGVYSVDKDTLKVCVNKQTDGVKERPQVFSTKDKENWRLLVFKRDKARQEDGTESLSGYVGLALRLDQDRKELVVADVVDGSPAKKAGLRKDDVVLKIADQEPVNLRSAVDAVRQTKPGSKLAFAIRRDGKENDITVKVGVLPFTALALLD